MNIRGQRTRVSEMPDSYTLTATDNLFLLHAALLSSDLDIHLLVFQGRTYSVDENLLRNNEAEPACFQH